MQNNRMINIFYVPKSINHCLKVIPISNIFII